jgi:hypothetical protein
MLFWMDQLFSLSESDSIDERTQDPAHWHVDDGRLARIKRGRHSLGDF